MTQADHRSGEEHALPPLTHAEQHILPLLLAGEKEAEIALELGKSPATVSKQVGAIYRAYGVRSKFQLIVRHNELRDQKNLAQNGTDGVNTPLQGARDQLNNPPVARKTNRRKRRT